VRVGRIVAPVENLRPAIARRAVELDGAGSRQRVEINVGGQRGRAVVFDRSVAADRCGQGVADVRITDREGSGNGSRKLGVDGSGRDVVNLERILIAAQHDLVKGGEA